MYIHWEKYYTKSWRSREHPTLKRYYVRTYIDYSNLYIVLKRRMGSEMTEPSGCPNASGYWVLTEGKKEEVLSMFGRIVNLCLPFGLRLAPKMRLHCFCRRPGLGTAPLWSEVPDSLPRWLSHFWVSFYRWSALGSSYCYGCLGRSSHPSLLA